jgi:hypothetical protein
MYSYLPMKLIRHITILALAFFAPCFAVNAAEHDIVQMTVQGEAPGTSPAAYQAALVNAQREAILQILETTLSAEEFALAKPLVANPDAYILAAEVRERSRISGATRVKLDLTINETALKFDLAKLLLPHFEEDVRVLVLIAESLDGTPARVKADGIAQEKINTYLTEGTLAVAEPAEVVPHYAPQELADRVETTPEALAQLARENLADVVVAGTARVAVEQSGGANLLRNVATLELRIVTAHDGKLHGAYTMDSAVQAGEVATGAALAVADAAEKLQRRVFITAANAALRAVPADGVVLTITGLDENEFDILVAWLRERHGEEGVMPLHFAPTRARIRIDYGGSMAAFMDAITAQKFPGFRLDTQSAFGRAADLAVAGRDRLAPKENGPDS